MPFPDYPGSGTDVYGPRVFVTRFGEVVLLTHRCCEERDGVSSVVNSIYVSEDDGATFGPRLDDRPRAARRQPRRRPRQRDPRRGGPPGGHDPLADGGDLRSGRPARRLHVRRGHTALLRHRLQPVRGPARPGPVHRGLQQPRRRPAPADVRLRRVPAGRDQRERAVGRRPEPSRGRTPPAHDGSRRDVRRLPLDRAGDQPAVVPAARRGRRARAGASDHAAERRRALALARPGRDGPSALRVDLGGRRLRLPQLGRREHVHRPGDSPTGRTTTSTT